MLVTQEPLFIQYSTPLITYLPIRTKITIGLQSATETEYKIRDGVEITRCDRAGLEIALGFGLQSETKTLKMDYKVRWDYKVQQITK